MKTLTLILIAFTCAACGPATESPTATTASEAEQAATVADIHTEEISYESGDLTLQGFIAYDANRRGKRPGVLVVHEWWGHNDYVRDRARMLAEMGYTAFAVDMYGDGKQAEHPADAQKFMMEVISDLETGTDRFKAAKLALESHETTDSSKIAAIGYCFGGAVVLHMARYGLDLDAVASFHGSLGTETPAEPGAIKAKLLVAHGEADPFISAEELDAFKAEMENAGADMKFIAYPGAVHGFTSPGATALGEKFELPLKYDEAADKQSWAELKNLLGSVFGA